MKYIVATDSTELLEKVQQALAEKFDLYTQLFVNFEGELVQRMVPATGEYEYQLIAVDSFDDLKTAEDNLTAIGYDYVFGTVQHMGKYLQWMCRAIGWQVMSVRDAVKELSVPQATDIEHAERADELQLVADVQEVLHMEPTANGGYLVKVPHPLLGS